MIEPEKQDRWSALAEELGLPPSPTETPSTSAAPKPQERAIAEPREVSELPAASVPSPDVEGGEEEEAPARGRRRRSAPSAEEKTEDPGEALPPDESTEAAE